MNDGSSVRRFADRAALAKLAAGQVAAADAYEARREALWARCPWVPRTAPPAFREAIDRGDFGAAEAMLGRANPHPGPDVGSAESGALARSGTRGQTAPEGPTRLAPAVARNLARMLDHAADLTELRGAAGQGLLNEPGANDT